MARLGCHCGADMTNTDGPSPHRLNVFLKSEVDKALSYNPDIPLWDFYTVSCGRILRNFKYVSEPTEKCNLDGFEELFILWDEEMDDFLDLGNDYRLKDYISQLKVRHYISSDQKTIYGLDVPTNKLICKYILE